MRCVFRIVHPSLSLESFLSARLFNSTYQSSVLSPSGSSLQKWFEYPEGGISLRYTIEVPWTDPIPLILHDRCFRVKERRIADSPRLVISAIRTDYRNLTATVTRRLHANGRDCHEEMIVEVKWDGSLYKFQIELDFFNALLPRLIFGDTAIPESELHPPHCPQSHFDDYHSVHGQLESLTDLSQEFRRGIEESRPVRAPLVLPSGDQISHIPDLVDHRLFSIAREIGTIEAELATVRAASARIRNSGQLSRSSVFPMVFAASCAAILFFVIQKSHRRP
jgi:hypothetical protein